MVESVNRDLDDRVSSTKYSFSFKTYFSNKRLFLTDAFDIVFNSSGNLEFSSSTDTFSKLEKPSYNWMHLIIGVDSAANSLIFTIENKLSISDTITSSINTQYIYFCNNGYDTQCNKNWIDAYYSKLRIISKKPYAYLLERDDLSAIIPEIITYFEFNITNINKDIIVKTYEFKATSVITSIDYLGKYSNLDKRLLVNIGNYISADSLIAGENINSISADANNFLTITSFVCHSNCAKCFGTLNTQCYMCNEPYKLEDSSCITDISSSSKYNYRHLPSYDSDLEFDFDSIAITNQSSLLLFIKFIYLLDDSSKCIIMLNTDLCFYYDITLQTLVLKYLTLNIDLYTVNSTSFQNNMNIWIPISISTFKTPNVTIKSMISMTYNTELLEYIGASIYDIIINQAVLKTNAFYALISHVSLFNSFIINPYGIVKSRLSMDILALNEFDYNSIQSKVFHLRGSTNNNCLSVLTNYKSYPTPASIQCYYDSNPYTDYTLVNITNKNMFYVNNLTPAIALSTQCCVNGNNCIRLFCDNTDNITTGLVESNYMYDTCDFKDTLNRRLVYHSSLTKTVRCDELKGLNLNRYQNIVFNLTPDNTGIFSIRFLFKTEAYDPLALNNIKFTIDWNNYLKIVIEKQPSSIYIVYCYAFNSTTFAYLAFNNLERAPVYLSCGVDVTTFKISIKAKSTDPTPLLDTYIETYDNSLSNSYSISNETVTIKEESSDNYGFTIVKDLQILKCNNCDTGSDYITFPFVDIDHKLTSLDTSVNLVLVDKVAYVGNLVYQIINTDK